MKVLAIYVILYFFQIPQFPVIPAITPLAGLDSLPPNLSDIPAANVPPIPAPSQYFAPAVILPSLPMNPTLPMAPNSPALPMQAVNLPHTTVASLVLPCQPIVPNMPAATIPLLAVAPPGVPPLPPQPVFQPTFQPLLPSDAQSSQPVAQPPPAALQPSVLHAPEPAHQVNVPHGAPGRSPAWGSLPRQHSSLFWRCFVDFLPSVLEVVAEAASCGIAGDVLTQRWGLSRIQGIIQLALDSE